MSDSFDIIKNESSSSYDVNIITPDLPAKNQNTQIKVYKIRWFILAVISIVNISNAINWIIYSSIADLTASYYDSTFNDVNYLSLVYLIVTIPAAIACFFVIDLLGLRFSIYVGSWLNLIGAIIRVLSSLNMTNGDYGALMTGQVLCAFAQPFIMFITTKFAQDWFGADQRALANTIALSSNTIGILIGAIISPFIIQIPSDSVPPLGFLNIITAIISLIPCVLCFGIKRSTPELPPSFSELHRINQSNLTTAASASALHEVDSVTELYLKRDDQVTRPNFKENLIIYKDQLKQMFTSPSYLYLFFAFGLALGIFNALATLIEQIVCVRGYSSTDSGLFGGLLLIFGIVGSLVAGVILDKTKKFDLIAKIGFAISAIANIVVVILQHYNNDDGAVKYLFYISFAFIGFFSIPLLPICMEMSVECVYPVSESNCTGFLFVSGQLFGVVFILLYPAMGQIVQPGSYVYENIQNCTAGLINSTHNALTVVDYNNPLYLQISLITVTSIIFIVFFKCPLLRLKSETN